MFSTGHYCEFPRGEYLETGGCEESGTRRVGSFIEDMLEGVEGVLEGGDGGVGMVCMTSGFALIMTGVYGHSMVDRVVVYGMVHCVSIHRMVNWIGVYNMVHCVLIHCMVNWIGVYGMVHCVLIHRMVNWIVVYNTIVDRAMVNWLMVSHLILRPIVIPPLTLTTCYPMINIIIIIIIITTTHPPYRHRQQHSQPLTLQRLQCRRLPQHLHQPLHFPPPTRLPRGHRHPQHHRRQQLRHPAGTSRSSQLAQRVGGKRRRRLHVAQKLPQPPQIIAENRGTVSSLLTTPGP